MRILFTSLLILVSISIFSQDEKRLALVIGNANYDKLELKNPVNDARLIASTLDSLDFDVILKENLATKRDMTAAIREFGSKRSDYDVAFVYYAGHGIQVDDENFLLPTKEVFEEEFDVMDYGVSVQNIMRYLRAQTNEVNILILDACRDNPFESKWNTTRSLKGGGLAKIPAPTGSLIAFSTDSDQTAPDGDGKNSVYTTSLAKNMLLKDTSIDQVFRNVRAEVLAETGGKQRPVEATQLTGQTFYLKRPSLKFYLKELNKRLIDKDYYQAELIVNNLMYKFPDNALIHAKSGHVNVIKKNYLLALKNYLDAIQLNPDLRETYVYDIWDKDNLGLSETSGLYRILRQWPALETQEKDFNAPIKFNNLGIEGRDDIYKLFLKFEKNHNDSMISYATATLIQYFDIDNKNYEEINDKFLKSEKFIEDLNNSQNDYHLIPNTYLKIDHKEWFYIQYADFKIEYGKYLNRTDLYDDAKHYLKKTLKIIEKSDNKIGLPYINTRLGMIERYSDNIPKAIEYYESASSIKSFPIIMGLVEMHNQIGNIDSAIKYIKNIIENNPNDAYYQFKASLFFYSIGDYLKSYEHASNAQRLEYRYDNFKSMINLLIMQKVQGKEIICEKVNFEEMGGGYDLAFKAFKKFNIDYEKLKNLCN